MRVWGILRKKQKIWKDVVVEVTPEEARNMVFLDAMCHELDIPRPLVLSKHENEWENFGRTSFRADQFMEAIAFDQFEIEQLKEHGKTRDPRNDFSTP